VRFSGTSSLAVTVEIGCCACDVASLVRFAGLGMIGDHNDPGIDLHHEAVMDLPSQFRPFLLTRRSFKNEIA